MKRFYFLIVTFFILTSTIAQIQISHFISENSDTKNIVKSIDGENYLLAFYQNDELGIFRIVSQDSMTFLHSQHFQGIYENNGIKIYGNHLIFESFSGFIIYDFINDSFLEKTFDYPVSYLHISYPSSTDFLLTVSVKDTSLWYRYIVDFDGNITDTINGGSIYNRKGSNLIIGKYNYENKESTYAYQNYENNVVDTLFSTINSRNLFCLGDDKMWFQDNENNLVEYEYTTGNKDLFSGVTPYQGYYHNVFKSADKLYLYNYDHSDRITHIQIFDINTKQKINEIEIDSTGRLERDQFYVYNDKIVMCLDDGGTIMIVDPETKKHTTYEMYDSFAKLNIIDGGKIFNLNYIRHYGYIFEFIDIESQTCDTLYGNHSIISRRQDFVKTGNNYIGSFYENYSGKSLFVMNLDSMNYYPAVNLDKTNTGFEYGSKITEINGKILVLADNLYEVNDDTLAKINTSAINPFPSLNKYKIQNGKVYYPIYEGDFPNRYFNLYSYDTKELKKEMRIKTSWDILNIDIRKVFDFGDYIYFISFDKLYRYNKADSSILFVDNINSIFISERCLAEQDGIIYYINQGLKMITDDGQPKTIQSTYGAYKEYLVKFKNRLFWVTNSGFYEIKGENPETIHLNADDRQAVIAIDKPQKNLIYREWNNSVYHFDGTNFDEILDSNTNIFGIQPAIGESFILHESRDSKRYYHFYDCASKELTDLPYDEIKGRYLDVFVSNGDSILLTKQWQNPKDVLYIYKTTDKFTNLELIKEIHDVGKGINANFVSFGNEGILYTGDIISLMDENMDFHPLEGIKGDRSHPDIIEKNGDLYFLAIEKTSGRQLFKTTLYSYRSNITTNSERKHLQIFPNPVKDAIFIKNFDVTEKSYFEIYSIDGKLLMQNKLSSNRIDISGLDMGIYMLRIKNGKTYTSGKFIKH